MIARRCAPSSLNMINCSSPAICRRISSNPQEPEELVPQTMFNSDLRPVSKKLCSAPTSFHESPMTVSRNPQIPGNTWISQTLMALSNCRGLVSHGKQIIGRTHLLISYHEVTKLLFKCLQRIDYFAIVSSLQLRILQISPATKITFYQLFNNLVVLPWHVTCCRLG